MISKSEACNHFANGKMRNDCMPHLWKSFRRLNLYLLREKAFAHLMYLRLLQGSCSNKSVGLSLHTEDTY